MDWFTGKSVEWCLIPTIRFTPWLTTYSVSLVWLYWCIGVEFTKEAR